MNNKDILLRTLKVGATAIILIWVLVICFIMMFGGKVEKKVPIEEPKHEVLEPKKQQVDEKTKETEYTYVKDIEVASTKYIPQVYEGHYVVPTTQGKLKILDKNGESVTDTLYKKAYYTSAGKLIMVTDEDMTESFGYAIGKEPLNEVEGSEEGSPIIYAYNQESGDVVKSTTFDKSWSKAVAPKKGTYIIGNVTDVEKGNASGRKYYWNTYTNKIYNVPENNSIYNSPLISYYKKNPYMQYIDTIYSVHADMEDMWQVVEKDKITKKEYYNAIQVAPDSVFAKNGSKCLLTITIEEAIELPETATSSTGMNEDTIMLMEDGVWKLYAKDKADKQE